MVKTDLIVILNKISKFKNEKKKFRHWGLIPWLFDNWIGKAFLKVYFRSWVQTPAPPVFFHFFSIFNAINSNYSKNNKNIFIFIQYTKSTYLRNCNYLFDRILMAYSKDYWTKLNVCVLSSLCNISKLCIYVSTLYILLKIKLLFKHPYFIAATRLCFSTNKTISFQSAHL